MALVKLGAGIADIKGKFGGVYFSRDASGLHQTVNYSKRGWKPTSKQFGAYGGMWNLSRWWTIIGAFGWIAAWATYASTHVWVGTLAEIIQLTGWNWFLHFNLYRMMNDLPPMLLPPETDLYWHVSGALTPDRTGPYKPIGVKNGMPSFQRVGGYAYLYRWEHNEWFIAPHLASPGLDHWKRVDESPFGAYQPQGTYLGVATVQA